MRFKKSVLYIVSFIFIVVATLSGLKLAQEFAQRDYLVRFKDPAIQSNRVLNEELADMAYAVHSLAQFFKSSSNVDSREFTGYTGLIFEQYTNVAAITYVTEDKTADPSNFRDIYFEKNFDYAHVKKSEIMEVFSMHAKNIGFFSNVAVASKLTRLNTYDGAFSVVIERISGTDTFIALVIDIKKVVLSVLDNSITGRFGIFQLEDNKPVAAYLSSSPYRPDSDEYVGHLLFFNNDWTLKINSSVNDQFPLHYLIPVTTFFASVFIVILIVFLLRMKKLSGERQLALNNLKFAQEKIVEAEKLNAMGGLVAGISHEVNTPLGIGITSISHIKELLDDLNADFTNGVLDSNKFEDFMDASRDLVALALSNMDRASKLVAAFKRVDVINADHSKVAEKTDVKELVEHFVSTYQNECGGEKINFHLNVDTQSEVYTYSTVISQILTYLATNALLHGMKPEEEHCDVYLTIGDLKSDGSLWLRFEDNGIGVEKKNLKKIFEPFYTTKRGAGNAGLGLSVVYNLVKSKLKSDLFYGSETNSGLWIEFELKNLKEV